MHARSLLRCHTTLALVRGASAVVLALLGFAGQAACIPIADPRLAQYESLLRVNPAAAETQALAHLADRTLDRKTLASLYEILAQAYSIQEKHDDVRRAVQNGIALVQDVASPTYVNFVYLDTSRTLDEQEVAAGLKLAQAAHARQVKGSAEEACVLIALGALEHVADRTDLASMHLTRAYRMSAGPERQQQRMLAAGVLSIVMQALRDFPAALALSREVIAWHTQRKSTIELSAAYFIEGYVLTEMGDRAAARVALKRSRDMSVQLK